MRRNDPTRLSSYATTICTTPAGVTVVTYHSTAIVSFTADSVTLDFGGYDTVTTRKKMNQAASQFSLPYRVYCRKGETYARSTLDGEERRYIGETITLPRNVRAMVEN
jgi:hypothetical protein